MPRDPDIGWQHGKMVGGLRHHVQCNYCTRTIVGGVTRFKQHLASKKGEIKGCDAVPKEVREAMRKNLATGKTKMEFAKTDFDASMDAFNATLIDNKIIESDESDREMAATRLESLRTMHEDNAAVNDYKLDHQESMMGARELFDGFSMISCKDEQGLAPPRATDPGWAHGTMVNGDRQKIKCSYCDKVILGGGISRLKQHLAGERGNITPCERVPEGVKTQMQQHLGFKVLERLKKYKQSGAFRGSAEEGRDEGHGNGPCRIPTTTLTHLGAGKRRGKSVDEENSSRRKKRKKISVTSPAAMSQPGLHVNLTSQEYVDQADLAVAKFMFDAGIPFSAANSSFFQLMADAIAAAGPGYKMPSYHTLRGKLLNKILHEAGDLSQELRKSWEVTGCSVMADRWTDIRGRNLVNFSVYCPKGTLFLRSVEVSDILVNPEALTNLFDCIVQEVGSKNVVQFLTDSSLCFKAAGKLLMDKHRTLFWSICSSHCIELMLDEFREMNEIKDVLTEAKRITQIIYNQAWVLKVMRKRTGGRDVIQPAMSKSETDFLTLQNVVLFKDHLHQVFTGTTWAQSTLSKQGVGLHVTEIVADPQFWSSCDDVLKVTKPLMMALHLAGSEERPSIGFIYDAVENAKKDIRLAFNEVEADCLKYLKVIDHISEEQLHSPLHAAAYYLNPSISYNPKCSNNKIQKGLLDCIETLEPDFTAQDMITKHMSFYEDAVGDFRRPVALRGRCSLPPATWWSLYASDYPELQQFAVRILSQTCSITRTERNWSLLESLHSRRRNRLEQERMNDLVFVHCNLSLQLRQAMSVGSKAVMRGAYDPLCLEGINANAAEWVEDPGVLESEDLGWMDVSLPGDVISSVGNESCADDGTNSRNHKCEDGSNII